MKLRSQFRRAPTNEAAFELAVRHRGARSLLQKVHDEHPPNHVLPLRNSNLEKRALAVECVGWLLGRLVCCLAGWLLAVLAGRQVGLVAGYLFCWLVGRWPVLAGCFLAGWLVARVGCWLVWRVGRRLAIGGSLGWLAAGWGVLVGWCLSVSAWIAVH